jgi:PKD repeat protein
MRSYIPRVLTLAILALVPAVAGAQGAVIEHKKVDCIVVGKHPRMNACFKPNGSGEKRKVFFRPEGVESWYYVEMKSNAPCHEGVLPKPRKQLIDKHIYYYVAVEGASSGQTEEFDPVVVRSASECRKEVVAPISPTGPAAVFPSLPAGFVGGSVISPLAIGAVAVVGAGTAVTVAVARHDDPPTVATTLPGTPPLTAPPVTVPPPTTPPPTTPPPAGNPLNLACSATPRFGDAPLRVAFLAFPTGGTGVYDYLWQFGDGGTSTQVSPGYTYNSPGSYLASVTVTSGSQSARCERSITVTSPPPPPVPGPYTLTTAIAGTGAGTVTSTPTGITCLPDCTETYPAGTVVTLTATPAAGSTFVGWSGAGCTGTGACVVTMSANQSVTATFTSSLPPVTLTVVLAGTGTGGVTSAPAGINCSPDCTEPYPVGTPVVLTATPTGGSTFAGWTGGGCTGTGTCTVTMTASQTVTATFNPPAPCMATLTIAKTGTGFGTVNSTPGGISCLGGGGDCTEAYVCGTPITLDAVPGGGSFFVGWTMPPPCSGTSPCSFTLTADTTVHAQFDALPLLTFVSEEFAGAPGTGTVIITPPVPGTNCPSSPVPGTTCLESYNPGQVVQMQAVFMPPNVVTWLGDCAGTSGNICTLTMTGDRSAKAQFADLGRPGASSTTAGKTVRWTSQIDAPEGAGQTFLNGGHAGEQRSGRAEVQAEARAGSNHVEAVLTGARGAGLWRFEFPAGQAMEPGSLLPLQGEVVSATAQAIVFRLKGQAGERVAFSFRTKE